MIVDHIKDNKDLYAGDIEGDFDDYIQNMKNNRKKFGGIIMLLAFSSMVDIRIELWTDIKDSAPYLSIGYANNQNVIKLLYSNWCRYWPLILSKNNLISRKNKLIKGKISKLPKILPKGSGIPLSKSEARGLILKTITLTNFLQTCLHI